VRSKNGADDLLLLMEKEAQKYINTPKLQGLLQWADAATKDSEGDFKPVGKRALAIAIAIANANDILIAIAIVYAYSIAYTFANDIAIANASANVIDNAVANASAKANTNADTIAYAIKLGQELKKIKIFNEVNWTELITQLEELQKQLPDADQPEQLHLAFLDRLVDTWCHGLHLNPEIVKLSEEETEALRDYLSANLLIIECQEAAVRISAKTWEEIESRMLLVPENSTL
jgi:hypothetical protein